MQKSLLILCVISGTALANNTVENEYGVTQTLLLNEDVKTLHLVDINADNRKDLVWVTSNGEVKYKLRNNDAKATLNTLPGTRWRLEYANDKGLKFIDFTQNGGVITVNGRYVYKITELMMTENGELSFCTSKSEGLNRTDCGWNYRVTEVLPNIMKGTDDNTGWDWVAHRLVQ